MHGSDIIRICWCPNVRKITSEALLFRSHTPANDIITSCWYLTTMLELCSLGLTDKLGWFSHVYFHYEFFLLHLLTRREITFVWFNLLLDFSSPSTPCGDGKFSPAIGLSTFLGSPDLPSHHVWYLPIMIAVFVAPALYLWSFFPVLYLLYHCLLEQTLLHCVCLLYMLYFLTF